MARTQVEWVAVPAADLPRPATGRTHAGYDPLLARLDPDELGAPGGSWRAGAARTAIVTSSGVRAYEQRSFVEVALGPLRWAAVTPAGIDVAALAIEAELLAIGGPPVPPPAGPFEVVLGPDAVAAVLDRLRPQLARGGALADRLGTRVAASTVSLSDSPRFATTLPRSFDALGSPRQPVPLVQDGVAHRVVSAETGHAVTADGTDGLNAIPDHLVLVGGGAATTDELLAAVERGLYLPSLELGFVVERGRPASPVELRGLTVDPLALLASVRALTSRQRTFATRSPFARMVGATVCPGLLAGDGIGFG
jgi:predicted Zn-dependent protease